MAYAHIPRAILLSSVISTKQSFSLFMGQGRRAQVSDTVCSTTLWVDPQLFLGKAQL
jgi:hypothetical protein